MDITSFFTEFSAFSRDNAIPLSSGEELEEEAIAAFERELIAEGKTLVSAYRQVKDDLETSKIELDVLAKALSTLPSKTTQSLILSSGETVHLDIASRERWKDFWAEAEKMIGTPSSPSIYDPALLSRESDDLLTFFDLSS